MKFIFGTNYSLIIVLTVLYCINDVSTKSTVCTKKITAKKTPAPTPAPPPP
jgi:hypothetical protein